jgi:hypothetical protein
MPLALKVNLPVSMYATHMISHTVGGKNTVVMRNPLYVISGSHEKAVISGVPSRSSTEMGKRPKSK